MLPHYLPLIIKSAHNIERFVLTEVSINYNFTYLWYNIRFTSSRSWRQSMMYVHFYTKNYRNTSTLDNTACIVNNLNNEGFEDWLCARCFYVLNLSQVWHAIYEADNDVMIMRLVCMYLYVFLLKILQSRMLCVLERI